MNPDDEQSVSIPELKDNVVNTTDTWSSQKIYTELTALETKTQTASDADADTYLGGNSEVLGW